MYRHRIHCSIMMLLPVAIGRSVSPPAPTNCQTKVDRFNDERTKDTRERKRVSGRFKGNASHEQLDDRRISRPELACLRELTLISFGREIKCRRINQIAQRRHNYSKSSRLNSNLIETNIRVIGTMYSASVSTASLLSEEDLLRLLRRRSILSMQHGIFVPCGGSSSKRPSSRERRARGPSFSRIHEKYRIYDILLRYRWDVTLRGSG